RWLRRSSGYCGGCFIFESRVQGSFAVRIRQEGPGISYEASGLGEGGRARVVGAGVVEHVGGAAIVSFDDGRVAGGWDGGDEAKDGVGFWGPAREALVLGGAKGGGDDIEELAARDAWVDGEDTDE
ncbi:hypothetical protein PVAP13_2KG382500, partial [Panicum virgatum]